MRGGHLESRSARLKLAPRKRPYWNTTPKAGVHLGYRRIANTNGTWVARTYQGRSGVYETSAFAQADDYAESDADEVLTYYEAARRIAGAAPAVRHSSTYSVQDAVTAYLDYIARHRKSIVDARSRLNAYVLPYFGERPLSGLTPTDFDAWSTWAFTHDPRSDQQKRKKKAIAPAERERRRRATLNKVITYIKAALERGFQQGYVESRGAWARLRKFKGADTARIARLSAEEARRLTNVAAPDFRRLLEVALITGARYGSSLRFA